MDQWTIDWVKSEHDASIIADFFTSNIIHDEDYISSESLKGGLSRDFQTWSEGFATRVKLEFIEAVKETSNQKLITCWSPVGMPLGFACISVYTYRERQQCILQDIFVLKEYRRQKIGTQILTFVHSFLDQNSFRNLFVDINPKNSSAMSFFREFGYSHSSNVYTKPFIN